MAIHQLDTGWIQVIRHTTCWLQLFSLMCGGLYCLLCSFTVVLLSDWRCVSFDMFSPHDVSLLRFAIRHNVFIEYYEFMT